MLSAILTKVLGRRALLEREELEAEASELPEEVSQC